MALPVNVDDLIHQRVVENTRIEYKADWNPEPILHSITAFANDFDNLGGGYIIPSLPLVNVKWSLLSAPFPCIYAVFPVFMRAEIF